MAWTHWIAAWLTLGLGSLPQQDVFQRVMAAKSERVAILSCYTSAGMYLTIAFLPIIICYCGRMLYPDLLQGDTQMILPTLVLQHGSLWMQILFFGALMSAILSTASGAMLAPATVIGENLIRPLYAHITDEQLLRIMRYAVVGIAVMTAIMALIRNNIYEMVGESSAISLVSLFTPLIAGLYWSRASGVGSVASMLCGGIAWGIAQWMDTEIPSIFYGFGTSILAMVVGSLGWPDREPRHLTVQSMTIE
jgi:Na+/proline symporter